MTGVFMEGGDGAVRLKATDSYRLHQTRDLRVPGWGCEDEIAGEARGISSVADSVGSQCGRTGSWASTCSIPARTYIGGAPT
jgi:hypothetical protein